MMYQGVAQSIQIFNFAKSRETPKTIPIRWDFSTDTDVDINMSQDRAMARFEEIRSMYFDCSGCASDVLFSCIQTGQRIILKAGKQGYRNVLVSLGMTVRFTGTAPDVFKANLLNIDMPEAEWPLETDVPDSIPLSSLVYAAAQYDVIGRKTAGAGAWEDCTRLQLNIAALDGANALNGTQSITNGNLTISRSDAGASIIVTGDGQNSVFRQTAYTTATAAPTFTAQHGRGTLSAPAISQTNDNAGQFNYACYDGTAFVNIGSWRTLLTEPVPAVGAMGAQSRLLLTANGSASLTQVMAIGWNLGFQALNFTFMDTNNLMKRRAFTFGTLPAAATSQDGFAVITDGAAAPAWMGAAAGGGAVRTPVWSNGAAWLNG